MKLAKSIIAFIGVVALSIIGYCFFVISNLQNQIESIKEKNVVSEIVINTNKEESFPFLFPIKQEDFTVVTSTFGVRVSPMLSIGYGGANADNEQNHGGVDVRSVHKAQVIASADGYVEWYWPPDGTPIYDKNGRKTGKFYEGHSIYGGLIIINHRNGTRTLYAHLSEGFVWNRREVKAGDVIGKTGNTGLSTGEHLHFEIIIDKTETITNQNINILYRVNPLLYIKIPE